MLLELGDDVMPDGGCCDDGPASYMYGEALTAAVTIETFAVKNNCATFSNFPNIFYFHKKITAILIEAIVNTFSND